MGINSYNQNFCLKLCSQDKLLSTCGCIDISTPLINSNAHYCSTKRELDCLNKFHSNFTITNIQLICTCPQQCELIEYDLTTNVAKFPTYTYLQNLATDANTNMYFPTNVSQNVTQSDLIKGRFRISM